MDVFDFREHLVGEYEQFTRSFTRIRSDDIKAFVDSEYDSQRYWPEPLIQINPSYQSGGTVDELVQAGQLSPECSGIFRLGKSASSAGVTLPLYKHQTEAINLALAGESYVLTTGTGSGKSLSYFIPVGAAFGFDDIDWFNKPQIPTESEIRAANEKFSAEHVTLPALAVEGGRQLAQLVEACDMTFCEPGFEVSRGAAESFALMVDYIRDYGNCASLYSEVQKLDVYDELQSYIDDLRGLGGLLRYAERRMQIKWSADAANSNPTPVTTLYLLAFPIGKEPDQFAMPKTGRVGI